MADQIIIELIGDPSGLKPAEEALKGLSKVSEENMAAFNKANEAVLKFTSSASSAAKAARDFGEAGKEAAGGIAAMPGAIAKSVIAISQLNAVIAGGAVKALAEDLKGLTVEFTAESASASGFKNTLITTNETVTLLMQVLARAKVA